MSSSILTQSSLAVSLLAASSLSLAASADPLSANAAETPEVAAAFRNQIFKHVDGSFKRLTVNCIPENGQPAANCTLLYLDVGKDQETLPTIVEGKASLQSSYDEVTSDPEQYCKTIGQWAEGAGKHILPSVPASIRVKHQDMATACTKSTAEGFRTFRKIYPNAEAMASDTMKLIKGAAYVIKNTCNISTAQQSHRFIIESATQLRYEYRHKEPKMESLGFEIVLFKNASTDQWNVLHQTIRADRAPASYKGRVDRYSPASDDDDRVRMDCKFVMRN